MVRGNLLCVSEEVVVVSRQKNSSERGGGGVVWAVVLYVTCIAREGRPTNASFTRQTTVGAGCSSSSSLAAGGVYSPATIAACAAHSITERAKKRVCERVVARVAHKSSKQHYHYYHHKRRGECPHHNILLYYWRHTAVGRQT